MILYKSSVLETNLDDLVQMYITKEEACKRAGCSPQTLDNECKKIYGVNWGQIEKQRHVQRNKELSMLPAGKFYYHTDYYKPELPELKIYP